MPTDGARRPASVAGGNTARRLCRWRVSGVAIGLAALNSSGVTLKGKASGYTYSLEFKQEGTAVSLSFTLGRSSPVDLSSERYRHAAEFQHRWRHCSEAPKRRVVEDRDEQFERAVHSSYELKPLSSFGLGKNGGFVLKLPGELEVPFAIGGIPFFLGIKTAFFVTVGFSNKNQSISGSYAVDYNGDAGFRHLSQRRVYRYRRDPGDWKSAPGPGQCHNERAYKPGPGGTNPSARAWARHKGARCGGSVDLVADTAIQVGGNGGALGSRPAATPA